MWEQVFFFWGKGTKNGKDLHHETGTALVPDENLCSQNVVLLQSIPFILLREMVNIAAIV